MTLIDLQGHLSYFSLKIRNIAYFFQSLIISCRVYTLLYFIVSVEKAKSAYRLSS